jgi:hypothetical protein
MEMSFCNEKGIPHSQFLGWTPQDRAKALAYLLSESERCTLCGTAPWEWEENRYAYEPEEVSCKGCYVKQSYADSLGKTLPGTTVELAPVSAQRQAQQQIRMELRAGMMRGD